MTLADVDPLKVFTTTALVLFVILMGLALSRMVWRLIIFKRNDAAPPYLLKRDVVLFGVFALYFGCVLVFRLMGFSITQNPFWIIPSTTFGLAAMAYWVWVEFHIDG